MTQNRYPQITDELLSAYLDEVVTDEEKRLIERALIAEPSVAWRLESLRQTVQLLRAMPQISLPRSFTLNELPLAASPAIVAPTSLSRRPVAPEPAGFWAAWRNFWRLGSPMLRNAAAVSFALFLVLMVGDFAAVRTPPRAESAPAIAMPAAQEIAPTEPAPTSAVAEAAAAPAGAMEQPATAGNAPGSDDAGQSSALVAQPAAAGSPAASTLEDNLAMTDAPPDASGRVESGAPEVGISAGGEALSYDATTDEEVSSMPAESISDVLAAQRASSVDAPPSGELANASANANEEPNPASEPGNIQPPSAAAAETGEGARANTAGDKVSDNVSDEVVSGETRPHEEPAAASAPESTTSVAKEAPAPVAPNAATWPALTLLQIGAALFTALFAVLWWRSRAQPSQLAE